MLRIRLLLLKQLLHFKTETRVKSRFQTQQRGSVVMPVIART
ncbi:hypothetical protein MGSAQ_002825 [marine sediment metagenome]|uniref:Uncharacterized protein n=1 Tax=marine sediment metagenome TaxID=412755 RepID=A0A1B6NQG0_9ZZZZ